MSLLQPPIKPVWPIVLSIVVVGALLVGAVTLIVTRTSDAKGDQPRQPPQSGQATDRTSDRDRDHDRASDDVRPPTADDLARYLGARRSGDVYAIINTRLGTIDCKLLPDDAPLAVANFVGLASGRKPWMNRAGKIQHDRPFYDGLTFHRVIDGFMIQGGDPEGTGAGGPGYSFPDEIDRRADFRPGTLAMANAGPDTNGSQFFIVDQRAEWLIGKHTVFGHCDDLEVIHRIASQPRTDGDRPMTEVTMTVSIRVIHD